MKQSLGVRVIVAVVFACCASFMMLTGTAAAATPNTAPNRDFSLQVTPSPLVTTVKPGETTTVDLKIRNSGTASEKLKIEPRSFSLGRDGQDVKLDDTTPPEISDWIRFSEPRFDVAPGSWHTQKVTFSLPKDTGFSYSFVLIVSRQSERSLTDGGRLIKGSVAVFTLINVDRPGAVRKLGVNELSSAKKLYEFLPATINVTLRNSGNAIVQPYGNIFIERGGKQIATLPVNEQRGYILPGIARTIATEWNEGFPYYKTVTNPDGTTSRSLAWDWSNLSKFRIGKYTAKLVAVYNDGGRDVPIEGEVSFWVIPWRAIILLILLVVGLWYLQHWRVKRKTEKAVRKALDQAKNSESKQ